MVTESSVLVKENTPGRVPLGAAWLVAALVASGAALAAVALVDLALPAPRGRHALPPDQFRGELAYDHLLNLTAIGARVSGSYEKEVLAVGVIVSALKEIARGAAPHHRLEVDVPVADGAFAISFLDGMNNIYRGVSSVVARLSAAGGKPRGAPLQSALLLNCHIDTVPDSPGASDDGAGCAVVMETLRALAAGGPLRHDAIFLFNGAEENIMQASHAFITQHKWARLVRAFVNVESCGSGGREVVFQAGPEPWLLEAYAAVAPRPFASSLAHDLFRSGLLPADTDYRVLRAHGRVPGLDLAWSAGGHVYHTALDTAARLAPAQLQHAGANVLALAQELLRGPQLAAPVERRPGALPVYFDVLGRWMVTARAGPALAAAAAALALVCLDLHVTARRAQRALYVPYGWWWGAVWGAARAGAAAAGAGVGAATALGAALAAAGVRLAFHSRPWLLAPLYACPALAVCWLTLRALQGARAPAGAGARWWAARAVHGAALAAAGAALGACAAGGLRSGFVPALWAAGPAAADLACPARAPPAARAALWAAGAAPAALQTWYLALAALRVLVPIAARAGANALPADVWVAAVVSALTLTSCSWMLPLVAASRPGPLARALLVAAAAGALLAALAHPYSEDAPQRLMVFHTRRSVHPRGGGPPAVDTFYWLPALDDNSPHSLRPYGAEFRAAVPVQAGECARWVLCGVPYHLPAWSRVPRSHRAPAPGAPHARLHAAVSARALNRTLHEVTVQVEWGPAHVVVAVAPAAGARLVWSSLLARPLASSPRWNHRDLYFFAMHRARGNHSWELRMHLQHSFPRAPAEWAALSLAGHALVDPAGPPGQAGPPGRAAPHAALLARLPRWVAATGWGVDLHLHSV